MTIRCAQGTVSISSALTVGQTVNVTTDGAGGALTGFDTAAARAIVFGWNNMPSTGHSSVGDARHGTGFAVSSTVRRSYAGQSADAVTPTVNDRTWRNDAVITILDSSPAVVGLIDYNGEVADGFQLIVDDQLPDTQLVSWFAIWGDELSVAIHDFTSPASTGNVDYAVGLALNTGVDDKAVIFLGGPAAAADSISTDDAHMLGVAALDTPANAVISAIARDNQTSTQGYRYCRAGECIAAYSGASIVERAALTLWNADGFRLNWSEVNGTAGLMRYSALVLKGPQFSVGDFLSRSDTTETDEVVGFDPLGLIAASHARAASSADTPNTPATHSLGFATSASSRSLHGWGAHYVTNADVKRFTRTDALVIGLDDGNGLVALVDIVDMSAGGGGFTFVMDDTENAGSESFIWYLAVGAALTGAASSAMHETAYMVCSAIEE